VGTGRGTGAAEAAAALYSAAGAADPYPHYAVLRQAAPVFDSEALGAVLLTRHLDCKAVLRDPRFGRGYAACQDHWHPGWREHPALRQAEALLVNLDPPAHTRLRKLVVRLFSGRVVEALRPELERRANDLVRVFVEQGGGDLVSLVAAPMARDVMADLLGLGSDEVAAAAAPVHRFSRVFEPRSAPEELALADEAGQTLAALLGPRLAAACETDLLGRLAAGAAEGAVGPDELVALALLLLVAGVENVTNLVANGALALARHPDQAAQLAGRPELAGGLADEVLRYDAPVQLTVRQAREAVTVGELTVPPGHPVVVLLGAGNRDPRRFADPDRLELGRDCGRGLGFGGGVHHCVGFALARVEAEVVLLALARAGALELVEEPAYAGRLAVRGPRRLALALSRRSGPVPAATVSAPQPAAAPAHGDSGAVRPPGGDDHAWRAAYRARMEAAPRASGPELDAIVALLARVPLFAGCRTGELAELAATAYAIDFEPGEVLYTEGAPGDDCLVLAEGEVVVTHEGAVVARVGPDRVVGERGVLLQQGRRAATVTAEAHTVGWALSRARLLALVRRSPRARASMQADLRGRYGDEVAAHMAVPLPGPPA
jgi:cytochrome P450